jgi:hypothetical protein
MYFTAALLPTSYFIGMYHRRGRSRPWEARGRKAVKEGGTRERGEREEN